MAVSNKNEQIICDWGFSWIKKYVFQNWLFKKLFRIATFHSFIQQMVSIFYYMLGSILLYTPVGTVKLIRIKTDPKGVTD